MFNMPCEIVYRTDDGVFALPVSVALDDIVSIKPIDNVVNIGVESGLTSDTALMPRSTVLLESGRCLTVTDHWFTLCQYLDAYKAFDSDYDRQRVATPDRAVPKLTLIHGGHCATSQDTTPA